MTFLRFLFVFYMAALTVYPCYEDTCNEEVCVANDTESSENQHESPDRCSPFCLSACCVLQIGGVDHVHEASDFKNSVTQNSVYTITFTLHVLVSIWQPPRMV